MYFIAKNFIKTIPVAQQALRRNLHLSSFDRANNIFNVQDEEDFKKRVLENRKPVIVDFYATFGFILIF